MHLCIPYLQKWYYTRQRCSITANREKKNSDAKSDRFQNLMQIFKFYVLIPIVLMFFFRCHFFTFLLVKCKFFFSQGFRSYFSTFHSFIVWISSFFSPLYLCSKFFRHTFYYAHFNATFFFSIVGIITLECLLTGFSTTFDFIHDTVFKMKTLHQFP